MTWKIKRFAPKVTKAEWRLRRALEKTGIPFLTQEPLKGKERHHRVDFYIPPALVVQVDGASHQGKQLLKDELENEDLRQAGFFVVRFTDREIFHNLESVLNTIRKLLPEHLTEV